MGWTWEHACGWMTTWARDAHLAQHRCVPYVFFLFFHFLISRAIRPSTPPTSTCIGCTGMYPPFVLLSPLPQAPVSCGRGLQSQLAHQHRYILPPSLFFKKKKLNQMMQPCAVAHRQCASVTQVRPHLFFIACTWENASPSSFPSPTMTPWPWALFHIKHRWDETRDDNPSNRLTRECMHRGNGALTGTASGVKWVFPFSFLSFYMPARSCGSLATLSSLQWGICWDCADHCTMCRNFASSASHSLLLTKAILRHFCHTPNQSLSPWSMSQSLMR